MFTGLVADMGRVAAVAHSADGVRLEIASALAGQLRPGDSVAVNGVCLTATATTPETFAAEVMHETLTRSSLADAAAEGLVNLELPLRAGDRLGGHIVQGHVDALGTVLDVVADGFASRVRIAAPEALLVYIVAKGSIAVDGRSLTVADVDARSFTVSLIPETLQRTTLGRVQPGSRLNLEVDVLAKYVEKSVASNLRALA